MAYPGIYSGTTGTPLAFVMQNEPSRERTVSSSSFPNPALIERLSLDYQFRDYSQVREFLQKNPFLVNVLLEAFSEIRSHFGGSTQIALEVVTDPEDGDQQLFAYILTPLAARDALALRDRLDEEWWFLALECTDGQLIIDLEFI
ncbi:MAG: hypothetical protein KF868_00420 [Acidobacteria bacterium]|nr:hypothetical protein [Acidobacteriota bacterium]MCW5969423.1 hypothetical protein [Blastocatellales bacterium]